MIFSLLFWSFTQMFYLLFGMSLPIFEKSYTVNLFDPKIFAFVYLTHLLFPIFPFIIDYILEAQFQFFSRPLTKAGITFVPYEAGWSMKKLIIVSLILYAVWASIYPLALLLNM